MISNHVKALGLHLGLTFLFAIVSIATMDYPGAWGIITALSFLSYIILGYFFLQHQETVGHDFLSVVGLIGLGLLFYMIDSATESPIRPQKIHQLLQKNYQLGMNDKGVRHKSLTPFCSYY